MSVTLESNQKLHICKAVSLVDLTIMRYFTNVNTPLFKHTCISTLYMVGALRA